MGRILSTRPEVLFQLLWRAFDPSNNRALLASPVGTIVAVSFTGRESCVKAPF
jgi:hypothetical protein